jgi:hypothetical protein
VRGRAVLDEHVLQSLGLGGVERIWARGLVSVGNFGARREIWGGCAAGPAVRWAPTDSAEGDGGGSVSRWGGASRSAQGIRSADAAGVGRSGSGVCVTPSGRVQRVEAERLVGGGARARRGEAGVHLGVEDGDARGPRCGGVVGSRIFVFVFFLILLIMFRFV